MNQKPDNVGAMWNRWLSASGAYPSEHSRRPRIPAGGAVSSPHTRRRGSHIADINRRAVNDTLSATSSGRRLLNVNTWTTCCLTRTANWLERNRARREEEREQGFVELSQSGIRDRIAEEMSRRRTAGGMDGHDSIPSFTQC